MNAFRYSICPALIFLFGISALAQSSLIVASNGPGIFHSLRQPLDSNAPVTATADFDPPVITPGETVFYRVSIDAAESSIDWPTSIPLPAGLQFSRETEGQIMQMLPGGFRPMTSFVYELQATHQGRFTIPAYTVSVAGKPVSVPAASVDCAARRPATLPPAHQLLLAASATNVYLGQPFQLRVLLPFEPGRPVQVVREIQFNADGFMNDKSSEHQAIEMIQRHGKKVPAYVFTQTATPIGAGERTITAQGFTAGRQFDGPITITGHVVIRGGTPHYALLMSNPLKINVRPLPVAGRLPGFTGGMGDFACELPELSTNRLQVGVPVQLTVRVRGFGDLDKLVPPAPPIVKDWQIIQGQHGRGVFTYTLIPLTDSVHATPAIPFSCFNPATGKYRDLTIRSVPVTVAKEKGAGNIAALEAVPPQASTPTLSDLAMSPGVAVDSLKPLQLHVWFVLLQLLPVILFLDLWQWGRYRKYIEAHPEIVRCRRAKRDLRRENRRRRRALAAADGVGFLQSAVAALRAVSAPHYPANPQALVGADVLALLDESEKTGQPGETVRRLFAAADAGFSSNPASAGDLMGLENDVADLLRKLEERL